MYSIEMMCPVSYLTKRFVNCIDNIIILIFYCHLDIFYLLNFADIIILSFYIINTTLVVRQKVKSNQIHVHV